MPSPDSGIESDIRVIMVPHFAQQRGLVGEDADILHIFMVGNDIGIVVGLPLMLNLLVLILLLFFLDAAAHPEGDKREQQIDGHHQGAEFINDVNVADGRNGMLDNLHGTGEYVAEAPAACIDIIFRLLALLLESVRLQHVKIRVHQPFAHVHLEVREQPGGIVAGSISHPGGADIQNQEARHI